MIFQDYGLNENVRAKKSRRHMFRMIWRIMFFPAMVAMVPVPKIFPYAYVRRDNVFLNLFFDVYGLPKGMVTIGAFKESFFQLPNTRSLIQNNTNQFFFCFIYKNYFVDQDFIIRRRIISCKNFLLFLDAPSHALPTLASLAEEGVNQRSR